MIVVKYIRQDIVMVVIYCCLVKENHKVFKFSTNNFCYFEIGDSLFKSPSSKCCTSKLQNWTRKIFMINFKDSLIELECAKLIFPDLHGASVHSFSCTCMLCTEFFNTYLHNDVKIKQLIILYEEDMEWKFEKPIF